MAMFPSAMIARNHAIRAVQVACLKHTQTKNVVKPQ